MLLSIAAKLEVLLVYSPVDRAFKPASRSRLGIPAFQPAAPQPAETLLEKDSVDAALKPCST